MGKRKIRENVIGEIYFYFKQCALLIKIETKKLSHALLKDYGRLIKTLKYYERIKDYEKLYKTINVLQKNINGVRKKG